jgi:hypothetical protein
MSGNKLQTNFAFCTMVYGQKYITLSKTLIEQIIGLGHVIYVLTNEPDTLINHENIIKINYDKRYFSFHEKLVIVRECLKTFDTAIYLDADVVLIDINDLSFFNDIPLGLHIFSNFGNIGSTFFSDDHPPSCSDNDRNTKYGKQGLTFVEKLGYKYKKRFHMELELETYLEHFLEGKWILKKEDGKETIFLEIWDSLVKFCEDFDKELGYTQTIGAGEGAAMSIAAHNSGITINNPSVLTTTMHQHFISNYQEKMDGTKPWNIAG